MNKKKTQIFRIGKYHQVELTFQEFGEYSRLIFLDVFSPKQYCCNLCNKTFKTSNGAHIHLDKYHDEFIVKTLLGK